MPNRAVFLDIDGPIIPYSQFLVDRNCSFGRIIPAIPVACVNMVCQRGGAKVVFNTTHNNPLPLVDDIEIAMVKAGLKEEYIHPDMKTKYPAISRENAVYEWLNRHPETDDWIAFDDVKFTNLDNLIWVDPDGGLHLGHVNRALNRWNAPQFLVM